MPHKIVVSSIQMDCTPYDKEANLRHAEELIADAAAKGAELIVLPELFSTGYRVELQDRELAEPIPGDTIQWMCGLAKKYDAYLAGSILEAAENGDVYDTAVLVGPRKFMGKQRKMHLWGDEVLRFQKGDQISVFKLPFATVGLLICYEIGFPEMARIQTQKGADILLYTSAFGKARYYVWDIASRSRALENGVFVVASNRCGQDSDTVFGGLSRIIAPDTTILASAGSEQEAVVCSEIDLEANARMRETLPYLRDLNPKLKLAHF